MDIFNLNPEITLEVPGFTLTFSGIRPNFISQISQENPVFQQFKKRFFNWIGKEFFQNFRLGRLYEIDQ